MQKIREKMQEKLSEQVTAKFYKTIQEGVYQELYSRKKITAAQLNLLMNGRKMDNDNLER